MDNPPSFSLGITQLDAIVQDIPLEFVPATFDEQDPDWAENRSKHKNDSFTMKKLKDKTASKSKKSTSKASKKKFDDFSRPRLPKIGNFDNAEDALNLTILFFVRTFMFSQHKEAPISVAHFQIVEDGRYINFSRGKITFEKLMSFWQQDFNTVKQLYSLGGMSHVLNVWMFECCFEHSYKNIQPTIDEVSRLDLSFSKDFETCDPTTYASTSDSGKLKRTAAELQQRVGTIAEEFGDFSTILPRKILIKAGFKSPVSPDQPLKKRKNVMFEQDHQTVMDDDTSGRGHAVHHGSDLYREMQKDATDKGEIGVSEIQHHHHGEIGVSLQSHQHKYVPSSSKQHEGTSKSSLDGDEIKNYINKCDVNAANKNAGHEVDFENEDCSDLEALEDEVGGKITDSIQAAVDTILFGLSTPSTTKSMDVGASSKMTKRHWDLPDSQIPPDFPDAQVRKLQVSKVNAPAKRERKKSRVLRLPYISKYGSGSKDSVDFDKEEKLKYTFDGYTINQDLPNELMIDYSQKETGNHYRVNVSGLGYSQLDFVIAYPQSKNWFYLMSERKTCWNDEHLDVIFYHLRKKSKIQLSDNYRYTTTSCFFKSYVDKTHTRYYPAEPIVELSTQQDYTESIVVTKNEDSIANIIHGFCMPAGLPWHMIDEVYVPINCGKEFHWVLTVIVLKERLIRVFDSLSSKRKKEPHIEIQKLAVMLPTYLSDNDFYDKTERTNWPSLSVQREDYSANWSCK
ncbi:hypothetical protein CQW23_05975 [Capsicum baccatum]|uniref:Ubiquitin-like protease family profile domain-containing protein n=1 Tax=Capsicum baccatum TaxID=33114 RepID=A0A2G2X243_CAPBA|nr:hypothetical protein CQW23_05975 [Capsicum baccatum]